jgi:hypothetical protein
MHERKLYLDDLWGPPQGWVGVRTADACIAKLRLEDWDLVSLDHDLHDLNGDIAVSGTGMDVVEWILEQVRSDPDYLPPRIQIHSTNVPARERMLEVVSAIEAELTRSQRVRETDPG